MITCDPVACTPPLKHAEAGGWDLQLQLSELEKPLDFTAIFGREAPTEIEVGSGTGLFLAVEAARRPQVNFLAIEHMGREVYRAKDKWRRRGLLNTRIVRCDALYFLEDYPADHSVDAFIILYSDPWPKNGHRKRRVFSPRLVEILRRKLKPGGELRVKTDVSDYYKDIVKLFASVEFLEKTMDRRLDLEPDPDDIETNFQKKAIEKGHPIHSLLYRRVAGGV